ncbi:MAG: hypothetical protein HGB12_00190 [Bacteroidetes bacterium]|nr:hypothetical protein [Bacteroidota bacterium]
MDLSKVVITKRDITNIKNLEYIENLNFKTLDQFRAEAEKHYTDISKDFQYIKEFVIENKQWNFFDDKVKTKMYNYAGQELYDFYKTYNKEQDLKKPKRSINITKTYLETLVASFAEIDPLPMAISKYDYNIKDETNDKINILLNSIFNEENNFDELYEEALFKSFCYQYCFIQPVIDIDKSETRTPIKLRIIDPEDVRIDPMAKDLNECDYLYQKVKMRYWQIKELWNYEEEIKKDDEPKDNEMCDLIHWWFRGKNPDGKTQWYLFTEYDKKWLKPIDKKGKFYPEMIVFDHLPLVKFCPEKYKDETSSDSLALEIIPINIQYNINLSEEDYNMLRWYNRPKKVIGSIPVDMANNANIPNGVMSIGPGSDVVPYQVDILPTAELEQRKQFLNQEVKQATGIDFELLAGGKPKGTYSNNLLQTMQSKADNKTDMMQKHIFSAIEELAYKALYLQYRYMDGKSIVIFDGKIQDSIVIHPDDILNIKYKIEIDTKDTNLMTRETKFQTLTQFMQYSQGNPLILYPMAQVLQNGMPHFFPDKVMDAFGIMFGKAIDQLSATQLPPNGIASSQPAPFNQTLAAGMSNQLPVAGAGSEMPEEDNTDGVSNEQLLNEWKNAEDQLKEAGYSEDQINEFYDALVAEKIADGTPRGEIIMNLEEAVNKSVNNMKKK